MSLKVSNTQKGEDMKQNRKLLDMVRDRIRVKHYSISTEKNYLLWIKHYILYHNKKHPKDMGKDEIESFLTFLANKKRVLSPLDI